MVESPLMCSSEFCCSGTYVSLVLPDWGGPCQSPPHQKGDDVHHLCSLCGELERHESHMIPAQHVPTEAKITKADVLSKLMGQSTPVKEPESILFPSYVVAPVRWDIMEEICQVQKGEPTPQECPEGSTYVLTPQQHRVVQLVHMAFKFETLWST
ncbi:hypothetical protein P4O66_012900 [Electrophorus voltai]|uniref:Uncharacterized protein n=1 Tax=Electrophorus voltai TaxID=2609070 RepID=A0AAD8ZYZ2_9TELE|nr:hypothetical protein P4O66_012900 [Electrophorus voltai]